jgi:hypothetical protein
MESLVYEVEKLNEQSQNKNRQAIPHQINQVNLVAI